MKIIIVGGGKIGYQLAKYCHKFDHQVTVIESDKKKINRLKNELNIKVILGDGTQKKFLEKADAGESNLLVAATSNDQDNLVVCQLAERQFNISKTITLVNNPGNEKLFEWLGVNQVVSSTSIMLGLIQEEIDMPTTSNLWADTINDLKMNYIKIDEFSPVTGLMVKDIDLPDETILITVLRGDQAIVPRGNTIIEANDTVIALENPEAEDQLIRVMTGKNIEQNERVV